MWTSLCLLVLGASPYDKPADALTPANVAASHQPEWDPFVRLISIEPVPELQHPRPVFHDPNRAPHDDEWDASHGVYYRYFNRSTKWLFPPVIDIRSSRGHVPMTTIHVSVKLDDAPTLPQPYEVHGYFGWKDYIEDASGPVIIQTWIVRPHRPDGYSYRPGLMFSVDPDLPLAFASAVGATDWVPKLAPVERSPSTFPGLPIESDCK